MRVAEARSAESNGDDLRNQRYVQANCATVCPHVGHLHAGAICEQCFERSSRNPADLRVVAARTFAERSGEMADRYESAGKNEVLPTNGGKLVICLVAPADPRLVGGRASAIANFRRK